MKVVVQNHNQDPDKEISWDVTYKRTFVYTTEGMYEQRKNKLWRVELSNQRLENYTQTMYKEKGNTTTLEFLVDYTDVVYTDTLLHIPFDHICCEETIYKKAIGHGITFIKNEYYDQTSYYFEIEGKLESFMFKEMFSFLL